MTENMDPLSLSQKTIESMPYTDLFQALVKINVSLKEVVLSLQADHSLEGESSRMIALLLQSESFSTEVLLRNRELLDSMLDSKGSKRTKQQAIRWGRPATSTDSVEVLSEADGPESQSTAPLSPENLPPSSMHQLVDSIGSYLKRLEYWLMGFLDMQHLKTP